MTLKMIQLEGRSSEAQNYEDHMDGVYPVKTKHFQTAVFNSYRYRGKVTGKAVLGLTMKNMEGLRYSSIHC